MTTLSVNNTNRTMLRLSRQQLIRWLKRGLLGFSALLVTLASVGFAVEKMLESSEVRRYPAPGQLVDVNGVDLHLQVTGQPGNGPTVILEAGSSGFSSQWFHVQQAVSHYTQVVSYDRMGLGWSENSDQPRDPISAAKRLHAALEKAHVEGPYLLVGHSLGGFFIRTFADQYPGEVVGMVMVDVSHPDQLERFGPEMRKMQEDWIRMYQIGAKLAPFGLMRLMMAPSLTSLLAGLPQQQIEESVAMAMKPSYLQSVVEEMAAWDVMTEQVRQTGSLGDMPLIVLSATEGLDMPGYQAAWHGSHAELATLSTRGQHRFVEGADHYTIFMNPVLAQPTIQAVQVVFEAATR